MALFLKNVTSEQMYNSLAGMGVTLKAARRIQGAVFRTGMIPDTINDVPDSMLERVRESVVLPNLKLVDKVVSALDGFARYVFRGKNPEEFEAVRIPLMHRQDDPKYIVCVSSQVGCGLGCEFCFTGKMGFIRNLETWEIVDQVVKIRADSPYPVRGVVFMGMGEPLLNYDPVMNAARILSEPCGMAISGKAITISTVGIVPGIRRFIEDNAPYRLVVSLTSADPAIRSRLIPAENIYSLVQLISILREYHARTRERVILGWTMISGLNTSEKDALQLAGLTRGLPVKLDLIDVNDPSGRFKPPSNEELDTFRDSLRRHLHMPVSRRYSGGKDIYAACGMLSGYNVKRMVTWE